MSQATEEEMKDAAPVTPEQASAPRRGSDLLRRLRQPTAVVALVWLALLVIASVAPSLLAPQDPLTQNLPMGLQSPSWEHWLGTDRLGRDMLSRVIFGTGAVMIATVTAVAVAVLIGLPLGLIAGYSSGAWDTVISRIADGLFSLPAIIIVLAAASLFGNDLTMAMSVFGVIISAGFIRLVRASTKAIRSELFIDAGRVQGLSSSRIALRHILPNILTPVVVQTTLGLGLGCLAVAGLTFLGLGPPPPAPTWGGMVTDATQVLVVAPWQMVPPGLVIILTVLSFNFLGDALTDRPVKRIPRRRSTPRRAGTPGNSRTPVVEPLAGSEPGPAPLLAVEGLTVTASGPSGDVELLHEVSFAVRPGESVALVGESGCGKSVTSRAVLGMLSEGAQVSGGQVFLEGRDVARLSERQWTSIRGSQIAYIAQEPLVALDPCFSVQSLLIEALRRHNKLSRSQAREEAIKLLARVGIPHPESMLKRFPHQLSGGTAQRVAIALALTGSPRLLIADEPTTALDVTVQAEILDLLRGLQAETGMAVLLVTHDFGVVADFCSRAVVMYAGQVIEQAPVAELFAAPSHPYTKLLLAATPHDVDRDQELPTIPGVVPSPGQWPGGCHFASRCPRVVSACTTQTIELATPAPGHLSRCLFADEEHVTERI
ncbi:dipeptide/oligopeptide/nickel ABC transporter permease/ATP-binding protein [Pseudarthrobacter raffinosi]|uniref:dipeptide/oligopeptide/nickel ABC transporter permease/ATP-binding protein n=1 Tax=Pseudarthrobacter raffinosi TaxID=2953651 RepID=UPI00208E1D43|nr:oligopeptide/dipeptide ABC transporter ATP-binding protein [Pseudarthrobacter sp. MDT3-9]MCO4252135.1 dipeptide/oligopeptide/nickel ABC transporter permease/ATP-binding protein [Pseudarthrobacter sp. MDT3-9]